jgi:hypothetical protein
MVPPQKNQQLGKSANLQVSKSENWQTPALRAGASVSESTNLQTPLGDTLCRSLHLLICPFVDLRICRFAICSFVNLKNNLPRWLDVWW